MEAKTAAERVGFQRLSEADRKQFVLAYYGFLSNVTAALAERGVVNKHGNPYTIATVTRTWYGQFRTPNSEIVAELEATRRRLRARDDKRHVRRRLITA